MTVFTKFHASPPKNTYWVSQFHNVVILHWFTDNSVTIQFLFSASQHSAWSACRAQYCFSNSVRLCPCVQCRYCERGR